MNKKFDILHFLSLVVCHFFLFSSNKNFVEVESLDLSTEDRMLD